MTSTVASGSRKRWRMTWLHDLVGADVVAFGAGLLALESYASLFTVEFEQLKISLLAEI